MGIQRCQIQHPLTDGNANARRLAGIGAKYAVGQVLKREGGIVGNRQFQEHLTGSDLRLYNPILIG